VAQIHSIIQSIISHATQDPQFFTKRHTKIGMGCQDNYSSMRVLHYPALPSDLQHVQYSKEDNMPLKKHEHVDYGSLTLLFPGPDIGGLQV